MVPVVVLGLTLDVDLQPVLLLTPLSGADRRRRVVRIRVDREEAASLSIAIVGEATRRPIAHDLLHDVIVATGATLDRVEIPMVDGDVLRAEFHLATGRGPVVLRCRPSDAIASALRLESPLFVAEALLEPEDAVTEPEEDEGVLADFRRFLDGADPADFLS